MESVNREIKAALKSGGAVEALASLVNLEEKDEERVIKALSEFALLEKEAKGLQDPARQLLNVKQKMSQLQVRTEDMAIGTVPLKLWQNLFEEFKNLQEEFSQLTDLCELPEYLVIFARMTVVRGTPLPPPPPCPLAWQANCTSE